ncbi:hypothetical protein RRG08_009977 [Elysia crispata]|uniref:Uncharacterized protein n=1 Tax=Elysia crispata TaxID=231223 RepID=A0AAE1B3Y8_9GAST|nr:hypothetical protein RRG08_009977 [Elysia crispata]
MWRSSKRKLLRGPPVGTPVYDSRLSRNFHPKLTEVYLPSPFSLISLSYEDKIAAAVMAVNGENKLLFKIRADLLLRPQRLPSSNESQLVATLSMPTTSIAAAQSQRKGRSESEACGITMRDSSLSCQYCSS